MANRWTLLDLEGRLCPQKGPGADQSWIMALWFLVVLPLIYLLVPDGVAAVYSAEELLAREGRSALVAFTALALHYVRIFLHMYVAHGDSRYDAGSGKLLYTAPLTGILLCLAVHYMPGLGDGTTVSLPLFLCVGTVLFPWYFALRGGLRVLNAQAWFRRFLERLREFPYTMALLGLLSVPAILVAAETTRFFFSRQFIEPLWPLVDATVKAVFAGGPTPTVNWGGIGRLAAIFVIYGTMLYGVFVLVFNVVRNASLADARRPPAVADSAAPAAARKTRLRDLDMKYMAAWLFFTRLLPKTFLFLLSMMVNYGFWYYLIRK